MNIYKLLEEAEQCFAYSNGSKKDNLLKDLRDALIQSLEASRKERRMYQRQRHLQHQVLIEAEKLADWLNPIESNIVKLLETFREEIYKNESN